MEWIRSILARDSIKVSKSALLDEQDFLPQGHDILVRILMQAVTAQKM